MIDISQHQLSLLPESTNQLRSVLHGLEPATGEVADLGQIGRAQVGDFVLQVRPYSFDRVELRGIRRTERDGDATILLVEPLAHLATFMRAHTIPHDQQLFADLPLESGEEFDDLLALYGTRNETEVEAPPGQPGDGRHLLPCEALLDDRRLPARRPRTRDRAFLGQSRLVYKDDGVVFPLRFLFFSAGQARRCHYTIASSSRWSARISGLCGVKPRPRNSSQPPVLLYATLNSRLIRTPTRLTVHSLVGKPVANAHMSNKPLKAAHWLASRCLGRPSGFALSLPTAPLTSANFRARSLTACRDTPRRRATSACDTLRFISRAPSTRRSSSACKPRFATMHPPQHQPSRYNSRGSKMVFKHLTDSQ